MALEREVKELQIQANRLQQAGTVVGQKKQLDAIDAWLVDNVNWFEQLTWLSQQALSSQNMMVSDLTLNSASGGTMKFTSLLLDQCMTSTMEERLRDSTQSLRSEATGPAPGNTRYRYRYGATVLLSKEAVAIDQSAQETPTP
jgi:predicted Rdx family selenoprotein